jgi:hypothetical protein
LTIGYDPAVDPGASAVTVSGATPMDGVSLILAAVGGFGLTVTLVVALRVSPMLLVTVTLTV